MSEDTVVTKVTPEDYNRMLDGSTLEGMGEMVGTGNGGIIVSTEENAMVVYFGPCGFCGKGWYSSHDPNALWGVCDYCGAI